MSAIMAERQERMSKGTTSSTQVAKPRLILVLTFVVPFVLLLCGQSSQFGFQPRLITRFCYNSPNLSTINSQCVLCNYYTFDATLLGCTGSTALTVNISASGAFCLISQCLGQVRQAPVFLGRRRKRALGAYRGLPKESYDDELDTEQEGKFGRAGNWTDRFSVVKQIDADVFYED